MQALCRQIFETFLESTLHFVERANKTPFPEMFAVGLVQLPTDPV